MMAKTMFSIAKHTSFRLLFITHLMLFFNSGKTHGTLTCPLPPELGSKIRTETAAIESASSDYGNIVHDKPAAVLYPTSTLDIVHLVNSSYNCATPFGISIRGNGHSTRGQDMALDGVVVDMKALRAVQKGEIGIKVSKDGSYADIGGEQLWRDVLNVTVAQGVAPVSWTDFLGITVGGTLSNAGISGQTFRVGPQISNVQEMDVITGKGEVVTCSANNNPDLFYGVLGGLGQFGIITRARVVLRPAPQKVKWIRLLFTKFDDFMQSQVNFIKSRTYDYVEGALLLDNGTPNVWRTDFFPPNDVPKILSLVQKYGIVYCIELSKNIYSRKTNHIEREIRKSIKELSPNADLEYEKEVSYAEFISRVQIPTAVQAHPWLNLFVQFSRVSDFNSGVFRDIVLKRNITTGPVLFYPMNKDKWDDRVSVALPDDEDTFYTAGLLYASELNGYQVYDDQNKAILDYCNKSGIHIKQYLGFHPTKDDWITHFGPKWTAFQKKKSLFDPKFILSPGQKIFN